MPFSLPAPQQLLRRFRDAGAGLPARESAEKVIEAILAHYEREGQVTVLTSDGQNELLRVGHGSPMHGIYGVRIHPLKFHLDRANSNWHFKLVATPWPSWRQRIATCVSYLGKLLQAFGAGNYRPRFPKK